MKIPIRVVALTLAAVVAGGSVAEAKSPPKGKYSCTIGSANSLFGDITIKAGNRYKYSRFGKVGRFDGKNKPRPLSRGVPYGIRFKSGGLNHYKGRWYKTTSGTFEIALENPRDGFESIYCDKRR